MFDGSVHRKTLALSDNLLSGDLPAWALQRSAVDPSLVVLLQARAHAFSPPNQTMPICRKRIMKANYGSGHGPAATACCAPDIHRSAPRN